jgi:hypothetical protein
MNVNNDISEELRSVSALVASISRQIPYEVPGGYFLELPVGVMRQVKSWEQAKSLKFSVPEGYFEGFAQQVLNRVRAGREGDNAGPDDQGLEILPAILLQAGRRTPYQAPEGYFEGLAPVLSVTKDKNPYLVPEGYFELVPANVVDRLAQPVVRSIDVPVVEEKAKVHRVNWLRYSAAAVVAGLILTAGWLRYGPNGGHDRQGKGKATIDIARTMSKVSDEELKGYLADQDTTLAQPVGNLAAGLNNSAGSNMDMNDSDVKDLLGNVSDGELSQYMQEHGEAMDIATN